MLFSSAIKRAVDDASNGNYASAIETLLNAISSIKTSKVFSYIFEVLKIFCTFRWQKTTEQKWWLPHCKIVSMALRRKVLELRVARPVEIQTERNGGIDPVTDPEAGKCRFLVILRRSQSWPNFRISSFILLIVILNTIVKL